MSPKRTPYYIIIVVGLLLYLGTVFFDFSYLDDQSLILENQPIINNLSNIGQIFTEDAFFSDKNFYYRPLLNLSLMLDAQVSGSYAYFYHLTNVFIHILVASLLFALLKRLKVSEKRSLFLSLFFLVHPVLVQAVAWIPGRNDSLLAVFVLATFLFFLKFLEKSRPRDYVWCLVFFLLAIFTKEVAIVIPVLLGFYYLFLNEKKISVQDKAMFFWGTGAVIFLWYVMRSLAIDQEIGSLSQAYISILENSPALIVGFGKFFLPLNLAIMPVLRDVNIYYGLSAVVLFLLIVFTKRLAKKWIAFGLIWFILFMLPAFVNPNPVDFYYLLLLEHRLYLPFIGLILMLSSFKLPERGLARKILTEKISIYLGVLVFILFIILAAFHLPNFKNRIAFWEFAVQKSPTSPLANRNLGAIYYFAGRTEEARQHFLKALELNPLETMAHNNLAVIYLDEGRLEEAEAELKAELEINPGYDKALNNLQRLYILKNQVR